MKFDIHQKRRGHNAQVWMQDFMDALKAPEG